MGILSNILGKIFPSSHCGARRGRYFDRPRKDIDAGIVTKASESRQRRSGEEVVICGMA